MEENHREYQRKCFACEMVALPCGRESHLIAGCIHHAADTADAARSWLIYWKPVRCIGTGCGTREQRRDKTFLTQGDSKRDARAGVL